MPTIDSKGLKLEPKTTENSSHVIAHKWNNMLPNTAMFEHRLHNYKGWQSFGALPPMCVEMASSYTSAGMLGPAEVPKDFKDLQLDRGLSLTSNRR